MQILKYQAAASDFLSQAFLELDEGDLRQASEKGWGAVTQVVKAVAEKRGWEHRQHNDLFAAVDSLARELQDSKIFADFHVASSLHTNSYEGWQTAQMVRQGLSQVRRFVGKLEPLLD